MDVAEFNVSQREAGGGWLLQPAPSNSFYGWNQSTRTSPIVMRYAKEPVVESLAMTGFNEMVFPLRLAFPQRVTAVTPDANCPISPDSYSSTKVPEIDSFSD